MASNALPGPRGGRLAHPNVFLASCLVLGACSAKMAPPRAPLDSSVALAAAALPPGPGRTDAPGLVAGKVLACRRDDLGYQLVLEAGAPSVRLELRVDDRTALARRDDEAPLVAKQLKRGMGVLVQTDDEGLRALSLTLLAQ